MAHLKREFAAKRIERTLGRYDTVNYVECGHPGCTMTQQLYFKPGLRTPSDFKYKKFLQKNWHIDLTDPRGDRCPQHRSGHAAIRIITREAPKQAAEKVFAKPAPANDKPVTAPIPFARLSPPAKEPTMSSVTSIHSATPSISDRRLIFAHLNDVYLDEKQGYKTPWTDDAVAKHLGTRVEWVTAIRKENFGPLGTNGEVHELVAKARALADEVGKALDDLQRLAPQVQKALTLRLDVDKLNRRLDELQGKR